MARSHHKTTSSTWSIKHSSLKTALSGSIKSVAASKLAVKHSSLACAYPFLCHSMWKTRWVAMSSVESSNECTHTAFLHVSANEASIFDGKSWCSGCAPTYPLANVVSSNAQRVAANSDNMMAIYRKTNAGLAHVNQVCFSCLSVYPSLLFSLIDISFFVTWDVRVFRMPPPPRIFFGHAYAHTMRTLTASVHSQRAYAHSERTLTASVRPHRAYAHTVRTPTPCVRR